MSVRSDRFPSGFLFGVGTADHQCEAYDDRHPDLFDDWERSHGLTLRGRATDLWNRYDEDLDLARSLGCNAFRFSIAWTRVEPEPGVFNAEALAHYRTMAQAARERGMEPVVTILHNVWPRHIQERGGPLAPEFPQWLSAFADVVARAFGGDVRSYVTINEPSQLPFGFLKPWWFATYPMPPGMPANATEHDQLDAVRRLIPNLFRAHTQARAAIRAVNPDARVGTNPLLLGLPYWLQRFIDLRAERVTEENFGEHAKHLITRHIPVFDNLSRFVATTSTLLNGNWWHLGMAGKLPAFLCPTECVGAQDFVGLDYYWGVPTFRLDRVGRLMDAAHQRYADAPVWPRVLYDMLRYYGRMFPGQEILIIENGCVKEADHLSRARYLREHVRQVVHALRKGVNVRGYLWWSITSNREWGLPLDDGSDFGLYHIDLDRDPLLRRVATPSAHAYRDVIARHRPSA